MAMKKDPARPSECKTMTDLIYLAALVAIFVAAQLYARWCGKL
jgi:hypothetical protein